MVVPVRRQQARGQRGHRLGGRHGLRSGNGFGQRHGGHRFSHDGFGDGRRRPRREQHRRRRPSRPGDLGNGPVESDEVRFERGDAALREKHVLRAVLDIDDKICALGVCDSAHFGTVARNHRVPTLMS